MTHWERIREEPRIMKHLSRPLYESTAAIGERYTNETEHVRTLRCGPAETMVCTVCEDGIIVDVSTGHRDRLAFYNVHRGCQKND
jgi:hypothetical protein